ncbi:MAG: MBL fold metallo-hydrolase [Spirochaetales bacterium]|nr:MBL fold metallo-hydrolase [Spirochaetales bacterium]
MQGGRDFERKWTSSEYMKRIVDWDVPAGKAALWHLGQNSFLLKSAGKILAIDPYLTDYCGSGRTGVPGERSRYLPVMIEPEDLEADLVLITHSHDDHADPYTLERLEKSRDKAQFLVPWQTVPVLTEAGIPRDRIRIIHAGEIVPWGGLSVEGTFCLPTDGTDLNHLGFLVTLDGGQVFYNTGDTAYTPLLEYLADRRIDLMTVIINGGYRNLSHFEAARLTKALNPAVICPCHHDVMPHNWQPAEVFQHSLRVVKAESEFCEIPYYEAVLF